jgi:hypothetical protein
VGVKLGLTVGRLKVYKNRILRRIFRPKINREGMDCEAVDRTYLTVDSSSWALGGEMRTLLLSCYVTRVAYALIGLAYG